MVGQPKVLLVSVGRSDYNGLAAVRREWAGPMGDIWLTHIYPGEGFTSGNAYTDTVTQLNDIGPQVAVVLGDRRETLLAACAVVDCGVKLCQLHSMEHTGQCHPDSRRRHAISHLADYLHYVPCVPNWGHYPAKVLKSGAPALAFAEAAQPAYWGTDVIACFHATPGEELLAEVVEEASAILRKHLLGVYCNAPGPDPGRGAFEVTGVKGSGTEWYGALRRARVMFGNSSSGIIEAASCGTWVVNVGKRQEGRPQSANTVNFEDGSASDLAQIVEGLASAKLRFSGPNVYGGAEGAKSIANWLKELVK